ATFTALSYAELSSRYPKAGAAYNYTRFAFGWRVGDMVGWMVLLANVVAVAAVALGFGGYFRDFIDAPRIVIALLLTVVSTAIIYRGVSESATLGGLLGIVEVMGLALVIALGVFKGTRQDFLESPQGLSGILNATTLVFFAYLGFEQVADLAEETKQPAKTIPRAILLSLVISAVFYTLTALAAVSVVGWRDLSASEAPLSLVMERVFGGSTDIVLTTVALVATASTVLLALLSTSRALYGMAAGGSLPKTLAAIHPRRRTPWVAIVIAGAVACPFLALGQIDTVAQLSNFAMLLVFALVNLAAIAVRWKEKQAGDGIFRVPGSLWGVPLLPLVGSGVSAYMMSRIEGDVLAIGSGLVVAGLIVLGVYNVRKDWRAAFSWRDRR
ncbi:MAG: amino acid permease, partial [Chloroflexi bacterium]|nr:amino acid permease [Chloroflexota bacterium]